MGSQGFLLEPLPAVSGRGQGAPWTSRQLIAGPSLMAEAAVQGANGSSGAIWNGRNYQSEETETLNWTELKKV